MTKKKVLIYNWDRLDGNSGGGVTVYVRNLATFLIRKYNIEIFYLNAGLTYTKDGKLRLEKIPNAINDAIQCFEIVNSPVLAPVQQSAKNLEMYLQDQSLYPLIRNFIQNYQFDVIHLNNIEGLSLQTLNSIKQDFPSVRLIYSAHNYSMICTRTNLWKDELTDGHNCDKNSYQDCIHCYQKNIYSLERFRRVYKVRGAGRIMHFLSNTVGLEQGTANTYQTYEDATIQTLNKNFDYILAVSERVREILIRHRLNSNKVMLSYIGTKVADVQRHSCIKDPDSNVFSIIYMGYMRKEKGFDFFADSMIRMGRENAEYRKVHIRIVARMESAEYKKKIDELREIYPHLEYVDGYNADTQKKLLQDVNLGIVPVAWEDNLPQVAIEQIAYGVPILVSNLGGVKELCRNPAFTFDAGDYEDFATKFSTIYQDRTLLKHFYDNSMKLVSMEKHTEDIAGYYEIEHV